MTMREENTFSEKDLYTFAEACMFDLVSTTANGSDTPEINDKDIAKIKQTLEKFSNPRLIDLGKDAKIYCIKFIGSKVEKLGFVTINFQKAASRNGSYKKSDTVQSVF